MAVSQFLDMLTSTGGGVKTTMCNMVVAMVAVGSGVLIWRRKRGQTR